MDGWKPIELKCLPPYAWHTRAILLKLCASKRRWPTSYYRVPSPALRKYDKMDANANSEPPLPLDHRLLSVYSALYRIEGGAWYRNHVEWLVSWIPAECYGGLPGRECLESAWDTQAQMELAAMKGTPSPR
jgi:hypothetical protein